MVGAEGAGCGASGDGVHHGGFYFEVAAGVEEGAEGAEDGGSLDEDFANVGGFRFRGFRCPMYGLGLGGLGGCDGW